MNKLGKLKDSFCFFWVKTIPCVLSGWKFRFIFECTLLLTFHFLYSVFWYWSYLDACSLSVPPLQGSTSHCCMEWPNPTKSMSALKCPRFFFSVILGAKFWVSWLNFDILSARNILSFSSKLSSLLLLQKALYCTSETVPLIPIYRWDKYIPIFISLLLVIFVLYL